MARGGGGGAWDVKFGVIDLSNPIIQEDTID